MTDEAERVQAACICRQEGSVGFVHDSDAKRRTVTMTCGGRRWSVRRVIPGTGFAWPCTTCDGSGWLVMVREFAEDIGYPFRKLPKNPVDAR